MIETCKMYFIMTGTYKIQSVMFNMKNKSKEFKNGDQGLAQKGKRTKLLRSGDCFGEISLLFGCKRTATVKS